MDQDSRGGEDLRADRDAHDVCRAAQPQYSLPCAAPPAAALPSSPPSSPPSRFPARDGRFMNAWLLLKKLVNDKFTMVHDRYAQARVRQQSAFKIMSRFKRGFSGRYLWKSDQSSRHAPHAATHARTTHARTPHRAHAAHAHAASQAATCRAGSATPTP